MKILIWILERIVAPLAVLLIIAAISYTCDLGGLRSNQLTNSIAEIDRAIESADKYYGNFPIPSAEEALVDAATHKWAAITARDAKKFKEARSEINKAREDIDKARQLGYGEIYVPKEKSWWEGDF